MKIKAFFAFKVLIFIVLLNLITGLSVSAQIQEPAKWSFKSNRINDTMAELQFIAKIEPGWHLYSQEKYPVGEGPLATEFIYENVTGAKVIGKVIEPKGQKAYDEMFEREIKSFDLNAVFTQKVKIIGNKPATIKGTILFQTCDEGTCVGGEATFSFTLEGAKTIVTVIGNQADTLSAKTSDSVTVAANDSSVARVVEPETQPLDDGKTPLWLFFLLAFGAGLVALLTPCVYPMIPMTVSYFMKSGSNGKIQASIYGLSIIAIYTLSGTILAVLFGAEFSNWISTHWIPNILFFLIFVIFAASFFGYFEITMPNWLVNKSVSAEDKGGTIGTVFMAFTLVLVSFSCTGPFVGSILVESSVGGQVIKPIVGMLGFSLAFALPFTLFALFPQWLNKLPKSGGWMNNIKVVLGFLELAFALKFLNVPDQTYHWGILDREIYLGFWIVIFTMMGFYLLGKIKFPHDSDYPVVKSFPRLMLIVVTFTFVIYLIPGLWGAPLKGISGWLPPMETQDFDVTSIVRENTGSGGAESKGNIAETPKYLNTALKMPHGLKGYFDYDEALKASKTLKKPVFVDFTGHGCTNCREMENRVWSDPQVLKRLRENFVLVALYVDDKVIELPKNEWYTNSVGREVKLLGKKNTEIQINKFGANAQPFYVILDGDGNSLVEPHAYDLDIASYIKFLDEGVAAYYKKYGLK